MSSEKIPYITIKAEDFNIDNFSVAQIEKESSEAKQRYAFVKYNGQRFIIQSKPIQILCGGIPKVDKTEDVKKQSFRPTNAHCLYLWLNLDIDTVFVQNYCPN